MKAISEIFTLDTGEYGSFYANYIANVGGLSIEEALTKDQERWNVLFSHLKHENLAYRYADGKWSVAELILHCIDSERIFAGRAIRLIRHDSTPLPGFDQDIYVENSVSESYNVTNLKQQWEAARSYTRSILDNANHDSLKFIGSGDGKPISARALGFIIPGHNIHHLDILKSRYGLET